MGLFYKYYSGFGASTGHTFAHAPQSIQASASITYMSPAEIALVGHSGSQAPHAMHESSILYAIYFTPQ